MLLKPTSENEILLAAIDLGSNSFRLEIARYAHGQIQRIDYLKETVRQGGDLDEERQLKPAAIERGLKCLARFGEAIKYIPKENVRAVATQTLREATNRNAFLIPGKKLLGVEIEVISGNEEARLIYQGVSRLLPRSDERRLVIDIGGRSTEFILGQHFDAISTDSMWLGSVAWSQKYFQDLQFTEKNFNRAVIAAQTVLEPIARTYSSKHWQTAYGSSGTIGAIHEILGYTGFPANYVTKKGLLWLRNELIRAKTPEKIKLEGLKEDRKAVIGGGLSVLLAAFDVLKIDTIYPAQGALRHGVMYGMLQESKHVVHDVREGSVNRLAKQFSIDLTQARHVRNTALHFFNTITESLDYPSESLESALEALGWAATLHEVGNVISHSEAHRHGAYILDNTEMKGFANSEQHVLSMLVLGHYGKLRKVETILQNPLFALQLLCLRLAVIFCHARQKPHIKDIHLRQHKNRFILSVTSRWQKKFPQTAYLLEEETIAWQKTDWSLLVSISDT